MNNFDRLIDDIDINNHILESYDFNEDLGTCYYEGELLEHLKMRDLMLDDYSNGLLIFISSFQKTDGEHYNAHAMLYAGLLILKISQNRDPRAFYLLTKASADLAIRHFALDSFRYDIKDFFFLDIFYLIESSYGFNDVSFMNFTIDKIIDLCLIDERFFLENNIKINLQKGQLFTYPNIQFDDKKTEKKVRGCPIEKGLFLPTSASTEKTGWKRGFKAKWEYYCENLGNDLQKWDDVYQENSDVWGLTWDGETFDGKTIGFYNIRTLLVEDVLSECAKNEQEVYEELGAIYTNMYNAHVYYRLKRYIIRNYHVNSNDGYANLRKKANIDSEILAQIPNDEYVCFLYDAGNWDDWVGVHCPKLGIDGCIHKSQLEER